MRRVCVRLWALSRPPPGRGAGGGFFDFTGATKNDETRCTTTESVLT